MYFNKLIYAEQNLIYEYFNKTIFIDNLSSNEIEIAEYFAEQILKYKIPIYKLINFKYFWKFKLYTNQYTLDPRADTELLIEILLKKFDKNKKFTFTELGIGTGAISIAILHEFKNSSGIGIEISSEVIEIANKNLNTYIKDWNIRYQIKQNDWLNNIDQCFDLCISNPPYLTHEESTNVIDPYIALYGGIDGCDFYKKIAEKSYLFKYILLEIGNINIIKNYFTNYELFYDYSNNARAIYHRSVV